MGIANSKYQRRFERPSAGEPFIPSGLREGVPFAAIGLGLGAGPLLVFHVRHDLVVVRRNRHHRPGREAARQRRRRLTRQ